MMVRKLGTGVFLWLLVGTGLALGPLPARADVAGATISVSTDEGTLTSVSVQTMAVVTQSGKNDRRSKIQCYFSTGAQGLGLELVSKDQRRIEALYQQIVTAAAAGHPFQITAATAHATDNPNVYEANLDSDRVYLILH